MSMSVSSSTDKISMDVARDPAAQRASAPVEQKAVSSPVQQQMSNEAAAKLVDEIQKKIDSINVGLTFSTYGRNDNIAVTVIEKKTGEVIREIPPKELQQLAEKLDEMIGLIFSKSA